ncbi:MAG: serine hydrolase domain-containing protein [Pseudomonadota bacterium]
MRLIALLTGLFASTTAAADPSEVFARVAETHPGMAIGMAYSVGGAQPSLMFSGKTHRRGVPVTADARWHIGSITKSMTAALAMTLVEDGTFDLDAPLGDYFRTEPASSRWQATTLKSALSHTARLPTGFDRPVLEGPTTGRGPDDRIARLNTMWDADPEGVDPFAYTNVGYVYAAAALEQATGRDWETLLVERILKPAGITTSGFGAPQGDADPWGHRRRFGFYRAIDPSRDDADNPRWMGPAGTVHMSLADLHRWAETLRAACDGRAAPISRTSCETMTTPVGPGYGLGLIIQTMESGDRFIWHSGSNTQWYAIMGFSPERETSIAITVNHHASAMADQMLRDVMGHLYQE